VLTPVRRLIAPLALVLATAAGCPGYVPPCDQLPAPTPQEVAVAAPADIEVEKEVGRVDCEVDGVRWVQEQQS
jgi:hypothetical protein